MIEENEDLFTLDDTWALAHCVGEDLIMGKGIAVEFVKRFGSREWLIDQKKIVGQTILLPKSLIGQNVFYMITKKWSRTSKPTYDDIEKCLVDMFEQAKLAGITKIGMPKIGCGLDGKKWNDVKQLIIKNNISNVNIIIRAL